MSTRIRITLRQPCMHRQTRDRIDPGFATEQGFLFSHFLLDGNDPAVRIPLHVFMEHLADCPERNHHPPVDDLGRHVEAISRAIEVCLLAIVADLDLAGPVIDSDCAVGIPVDTIVGYSEELANARIGIRVRPFTIIGCTSKLTWLPLLNTLMLLLPCCWYACPSSE